MKDTDKAVEIMKAAMEKEKAMKDKSQDIKAMQTDAEADNEINDNEIIDNEASECTLDSENLTETKEAEAADTIQEEAAPADNTEGKPDKTVKSLFKNGKSKELAEKNKKIEELNDRLLRSAAEFDNFRKRSDKEKSAMYDMGVKSMLEKMLPIVDNFERGLGTLTEKEKEGAFAQGIELIYKQLMTALDDIGLKPIDAVGKEFDPNLHNAVMHGEDENLEENIVSDEFQKGYMYHDMVVRHSMVKVVN